MQQIENTLISDDLLEKQFVCDLTSCKGACCVEGDSGAPLEESEKALIEKVFPIVAPYLSEESLNVIKHKGKHEIDIDGDLVTPLLPNGTCVYAITDDTGCLKCGIEQAYIDGKTNFKKPISCHLFPVRIKNYSTFTAVNVQLLSICNDACILGEKLKVPVYEFLKEPLIRKFGDEWYQSLTTIANNTSQP